MALPDYRNELHRELSSREELRQLQSERLRHMVRYVYEHAPFWRRKFDGVGLKPEDIRGVEDLPKIPFCTRQELEADQRENPPFGSYVCTSRESWRKFFTTSGTTGRPLRRVFSGRDWDLIIQRMARARRVGPGDIYMVLGPTDGLIGPTMGTEAAAAAGAMVVHAGMWDTRTKIRMMQELKPAVVSGTTSYLVHVTEVAAEMGVDLRQAGIRALQAAGEPGVALTATRNLLKERFGAERIHDGYGMTEIFGLGSNCPYSPALHVYEDAVIVECVDPETGEQLPPGERGELVYTNLLSDTQPLLRYRSRDLGRLSGDSVCECGNWRVRIVNGIEGRADDMIWYRGVNFFPSAVEETIRRLPELSPEYRIVIGGTGALPTLTVEVEVAQGEPPAHELPQLQKKVSEALRAAIKVRPQVAVLPYGTLPRSQGGKLKRVIHQRS